MPKIATYKFLTFFIYSFDIYREPPHLHIVKEKGMKQRSAKIWLHNLSIADKGSLKDSELRIALKIIKLHQNELLRSLEKIKKGKKTATIKLK